MIGYIPGAIPPPPDTDKILVQLGPFAIRYYAVAILLGIIVAIFITDRRYRAKGGPTDTVLDVGVWAVIFGIIGARIYYIISTPDAYFGANGRLLDIFKIWEGGMAIIGGLIGGAIGIGIALRRRGLHFLPFADALAPSLLVAQAIGRFGNYFNQELFGIETNLPWGLQIDSAHLPAGVAPGTLFHPTFLYEQLWNLAGAALLIFCERKFRLRGGQVIAGYFVIYGFGRFWIEMIRTDFAHSFGGLRFNSWAALIVFAAGTVAFVLLRRITQVKPELAEIRFVSSQSTPLAVSSGQTVSSGQIVANNTREQTRAMRSDDAATQNSAANSNSRAE